MNKCGVLYKSLYKDHEGYYVADVYKVNENGCGYYLTYRFLWYSKGEVIRKLRSEYGIVVPKQFC